MRRPLVFVLLAAWAAACADLVAGFHYPVPALAPLGALVALGLFDFLLWLAAATGAALVVAWPIERLARRGYDRDALWLGVGVTLALFAGMSAWQDLRRLPFDVYVAREWAPSFMLAAWGAPLAYWIATALSRATRRAPTTAALAAAGCGAATLALLVAWLVRGVGAAPPTVVPSVTRSPGPIRHVILVSVDTLRADALSVYSDDAPSTPRLEALAQRSIVFDQAVAPASWTKPSLASLQTGLPPARHGVKRMADRLPDELDTLADVFTSAGYVTGLIGFNPYLDPSGNLGQGFQHYRGYPRGRLGQSLAGRAADRWDVAVPRDAGDTPGLTREAIAFIEAHRDEPFFLWLHYYDPHQPYSPPPEYAPDSPPPSPDLARFSAFRSVRSGHRQLDAREREWIRELYRGEVRQADANVGQVIDALERLGLFDDALFVFTSDHGEEFWEHGGYEHGHALFEELLHVPLIVKLPGARTGARVAARVGLESVFPTIVGVAGLEVHDGETRSPSLLTEAGRSDLDKDFVSEANIYYEAEVALTRNGFKYVRSLVTGEESLYDLARDPGEKHSIADAEPARLADLRARLAAKPGVAPADATTKPEMDPSMLRNLKALGYAE